MGDYQFIRVDQPAVYEIRVQGRLTSDLSDWLQGDSARKVVVNQAGNTVTVLTGCVLDQAGLHGLLNQIRNLGVILLYVDCLTAHGGVSKEE